MEEVKALREIEEAMKGTPKRMAAEMLRLRKHLSVREIVFAP